VHGVVALASPDVRFHVEVNQGDLVAQADSVLDDAGDVADSDRTGGRRRAKHQFIDANDPEIDDLGKEGNEFRVRGYVLGDDYMTQRDQLLSVLQDVAGPGDLVHPFFGHLRAQVGPVSLLESKEDGGVGTFQIEFSHAPLSSSPTATLDLNIAVISMANDLVISNRSNLLAEATILSQPTFALQSMAADLAAIASEMEDKLSPLATLTQELAIMSAEIKILKQQSVALVRTPGVMLDRLISVSVELVESTLLAPLKVAKALIDVFALPATDDAIGDTLTRTTERANQALYADAMRTVLVAESARVVTGATFESLEQAIEARDLIANALDELAATAGSETFPDIVNLRSAILRAIPGDSALARVRTINQPIDVPSLVLSYLLYGDTDSAEDIIARNGVNHPGYVSGTLNVLTDV
jgi:prophage DNA circulation protein